MVIDTSAIIAVLCDEPERRHFNELIEADPTRLVSAASMLESAIVLGARFGRGGVDDLEAFIAQAGIAVRAFTASQARLASDAYQRYGRGNHRANLNFGDCFAYALAQETGEPLLFKGKDFAQTDVTPAP